ncbi:MAG: substrate-binding domain-containing protein [Nitrososphaeria archaeon]|jgi:simple sugar transport system substrate-binding protein
MTQEPKKMERRNFIGYMAAAIIATGVVVGAGTYLLKPSSTTTSTVTSTSTTTAVGTGATTTVTGPTTTISGPTTTIPQYVYTTSPSTPTYKFAWIVHGLTDPFFVPAIQGVKDADAQYGVTTDLLGPSTNDVPTQVNDLTTAVAAKYNGIACSMPDPTAFNSEVNAAMAAGIPVFTFNVDAANNRLGYIGNNPTVQGNAAGNRILASSISGVKIGSGDRALITDIPSVYSCHLRALAEISILQGAGLTVDHITLSNDIAPNISAIADLVRTDLEANPTTKVCHGCGNSDTSAMGEVAQALNLSGKIVVGGYDLSPTILGQIQAGNVSWTLADLPYLQGYVSVMLLYMYLQSHRSVAADMNTATTFVDSTNVAGYLAEHHYMS